MDLDIFGDIDKTKLRQTKPEAGTPPKKYGDEPVSSLNIRKLKPVSGNAPSNTNLFDTKLTVGNIVLHERFGKGQILNMEGIGADKKAEIKFEVGGIKKTFTPICETGCYWIRSRRNYIKVLICFLSTFKRKVDINYIWRNS